MGFTGPGRGEWRTRVAALANDWQLSGILTAGMGVPYSVGFSYAGGAVATAIRISPGPPITDLAS